MKKFILIFWLIAAGLISAQVIPPPNPGGGGSTGTNTYRFNTTQFSAANVTNISIINGALVTNMVLKFPADTTFTNLGVGTLTVTNLIGPWTNGYIASMAGLGTNTELRGGSVYSITNNDMTARYVPFAQLDKTFSTSMFFQGTNRVGINTAAPEAFFHAFQAESGQTFPGGTGFAWENTPNVAWHALGANTGFFQLSVGSPAASVRGAIGYTLSSFSGGIPADTWFLRTAGNENFFFVGSAANFGIGLSAFGTSLTKGIGLGSGTAPTTFPADMIQIRSGDVGGVAGQAGMFVYGENGLAAQIGTNSQFPGSLQIQRAITNLANASANPAKFTSAGMLTNAPIDLTGSEVTGLLKAASIPILTGGEVEAAGGTAVANLTTTGVTPGTYDSVTVDSKGRVTAGAAPAPSPSTPASTTGPPTNGLTMRLVADAIAGPNNMVVTNWPDISGYSHHGGSASNLVLKAGVANGHAAVDFGTSAGFDGFLDVTNFFTGYTAGSIFFVMRLNADPAVQSTKSGLMEFGALASTAPMYPSNTVGVIYEGFGSTTIHTVGNPVQGLNTWHTYDVSMDASAYTVSIDGTNFLAGSSHTVGWHTNGYIGKSDDVTMAGTFYLRGQIAEVLMYDRTLTAPDRLTLATYVNATYGVPIAQTPTLSVTAGLVARWESEGLTNMVNGDTITNWFDSSSFARTATQGTAANRPTYQTNIFGNKPAARFDGVNDELTFSHNSIGSFTTFIVWNATGDAGATANFGGPLGFSETGKSGFSLVSESGSSAAYRSHLVVFDSSSEVANLTIPSEGLNLSQAQRGTRVDMWRWTGGFTGVGGVATMAISGNPQTVSNGGTSYSRTDSIGKGYAYIKCDIGAILVYNRALADSEVSAVTAYLNQKYPAAAVAYTALPSEAAGGTGADLSAAPVGSVFYQGTNGFSYSPSFKYNSTTPSLQLSNSATLSVSGRITNDTLTASLPVKTDANKALTSGAIDLGSAEATGTLAAARMPSLTGGNVTSSAGSVSASFNGTLTGNMTVTGGDVIIASPGKGLQLQSGTNCKVGLVNLVGGTATVNTTALTGFSYVLLSSQPNGGGGTPGFLRVSAQTLGTSFVITSSDGTDTSTVLWIIVEVN